PDASVRTTSSRCVRWSSARSNSISPSSARETAPQPDMLAFVVNQFPRQVDAYFLRELLGLHERGLDFAIYSLLHPPRGWKVHADARPLLERVVYPPRPTQLVATAGRVALSKPGTTAAALAHIVWGHRSMPGALAKSVAI